MKIACSKLDCYTDYNKCKDCQYKEVVTPTYVSCYHALNADDLKFNVAVFKDSYNPQKEQKDISSQQKEQDAIEKKESVTIETVKSFDFEVYDRVILTEI